MIIKNIKQHENIFRCPDWQYPTRASPDRLRRTIRERRSTVRLVTEPYNIFLKQRINEIKP